MNQYAATQTIPNAPLLADLRSDTVTRPDEGMRRAMAAAEVGDDVYGEDPQVNRLESVLAERLGKESGLFVPSGTQSNLIALLCHCQRGEEILVGRGYHVQYYEAAGASVLGGIALTAIDPQPNASLAPEDITAAVRPDDVHFAVTRLLSLENTHDGHAIPLGVMQLSVDAARAAGLAVHLDGARFFNAITELACDPQDLAGMVDTVSVCLSKGLGAPVGSVLLGPRDLITRARRWRKMLGGGMRQAGVLAAAGLYALDHNVDRLSQDHQAAAALADALAPYGSVSQGTNMVFFEPVQPVHDAMRAHFEGQGIRIAGGYGPIRMVLHKDVPPLAIATLADQVGQFFD
ncbi:MAG: low-specificity L-threonine aldolase [Marinibacterium sp.]|nr:low-specificity L-threonine aldolase [Marinibacterium sp.]